MRLLILALLGLAACAPLPDPRLRVERIAVVSAFEPELKALLAHASATREEIINGVVFTTGKLGGKDVVLFESGVSMVNAAMSTQMALDHFRISRIVVSGIAGGVDPSLDVGDVVVAGRWGQYLEAIYARKTKTGFEPPTYLIAEGEVFPNLGMIYPRATSTPRGKELPERRFWFDADPAMLAIARNVSVSLQRCAGDKCLRADPKVVVGGNGVSGPAFVDNAELRQWAFATFQAEVLDMESAAVAHVAYTNHTPFIAFRSLSDLAGGDPGQNQAGVFFQLASDNSAAVVTAFLAALP